MVDSVRDPARAIQINGNRFVGGLMWQMVLSPAEAKKEMSVFAQQEGKNLGTLYAGTGSIQAGYMHAEKADLKRFSGAYSLGSVLAAKLGTSWIGAFELDDAAYPGTGVAVLAVRDGMILPGCDVICSHDEAATVLRDYAHMGAWSKAFVTDAALRALLPVDDSVVDETPLAELLTEKKYDKDFRLSVIHTGVDHRTLAIAAVAIVAAGTWYGYHHYQVVRETVARQLHMKAALRRQAAQKRIAKEKALAQVMRETVMPPWVQAPAADSLLAACHDAIDKMPLTLGGWVAIQGVCDKQGLVTDYIMAKGSTMADFDAAARALKASGAAESYTVSAAKGAIRIAIGTLPARGLQAIPRFDDWLVGWSSRFQALGLSSSLKLMPHPRPRAPTREMVQVLGKAEATPRVPWWNTYQWTFSTVNVPAWDVLPGVSQPGFVLKSIQIDTKDPKTWKWDVTGEIYVKN